MADRLGSGNGIGTDRVAERANRPEDGARLAAALARGMEAGSSDLRTLRRGAPPVPVAEVRSSGTGLAPTLFSLTLTTAPSPDPSAGISGPAFRPLRPTRTMANSRSAVLLIGFQNDYFAADGILHQVLESSEQTADVLNRTLSLLSSLEERDVPAISVLHPVLGGLQRADQSGRPDGADPRHRGVPAGLVRGRRGS